MKTLISMLLFALTLNHSTASTEILLTNHSPKVMQEVHKYFTVKKKMGRIILLTPINESVLNKIPLNLRFHLQLVPSNEIKQIVDFKKSLIINKNLDQFINEQIKKISAQNLKTNTDLIAGKYSRRSGADGNQEITKWVESNFESFKFEIEKDCFSPGLCNIIGTKKGEIDEYILIEAHLDSVGKPYAGADDNASGLAALIEIARIAQNFKTKRGIIFFATNGEESGLLGSKVYVRNAKERNFLTKIKFVINMDMIAYNENGKFDIETDRKFENEAKEIAKIATQFTNLTPTITMPAWGSDHVPFVRAGVPGVLTIEHWDTKNPCYHQECDTSDILNFNYAKEISKLNLATLILKSEATNN